MLEAAAVAMVTTLLFDWSLFIALVANKVILNLFTIAVLFHPDEVGSALLLPHISLSTSASLLQTSKQG